MDVRTPLPYSPADRLALRGGRAPARPQISAETGFEAGQGGDVSPDLTVKDVADGRVVDARGRFGRPQAPPVEGGPEAQGEEPGDLCGRIGAGDIRPVRAPGVWSGSGGPGHRPTVDAGRRQVLVATTVTVTPSRDNGGRNQLPTEAEDAVAGRIRGFTPDMPERYWRVIEAFVRAAVTDAQPSTPYAARDLLSVTSRYVLWCWQTAGLDLDRKVVFDRLVIEEFIARGCPALSSASRGNRRSQLLRMSEALLGPEGSPARLAPLPPSDPVRPYSTSELLALRSWAAGQSTATARRDAGTLLALGAGAGLAVEDVAGLTAGMVTVDDLGVFLAVPGRRPRLVPVLASWETPIIEATAVIPADRPLFRERRTTPDKNFVANFVDRSAGVGIKPSVQRLRATWIVGHLTASTPVVALMAAAGVESLEALTRYLRFVPGVDPAEARRLLRGQLRDHRSE